jgi:hypothetical protein
MRTPTHIMIHHSYTSDSETVSWAAIEKFHKETMKWLDIAYHAGVECVTNNLELYEYKYQALIGRPVNAFAAACPQGRMNEVALHVCCIGNFDIAPPPKEMIDVLLKRILIPWSEEFSIPVDNWVGHRDYNSQKSCPGTQFNLAELRHLGTKGFF